MEKILQLDADKLRSFFIMGEANLAKNKELVNALNVFPVPDGDTGTNMGLTIRSAVKDLVNCNTIDQMAKAISNGALMGARGNSGVILSQLFRGFTQGIAKEDTISAKVFARALQKGVDIAYKSVLKPVEGTILTVSKAVAQGAIGISEEVDDILVVIEESIRLGKIALDNTPNQLPVLKEAGVVDAGGMGYIIFLEGALMGLKGEVLSDVEPQKEVKIIDSEAVTIHNGGLLYKYCTEFFIQGSGLNVEIIKMKISGEGDSLLTVGEEYLVKVHIHTNDPGKILSYAATLGDLSGIKIDNMKLQVEARSESQVSEEEQFEEKACGIVAVASGNGMAAIFKSMGVDIVINGGQTMNPSAEEILEQVDKLPSDEIVLLPNNSNIILAAEQAAKLSKKHISVVPTKFVTQGLASLLAYDADVSADENGEAMIAAASDVVNGEITYAVRNSTFNGLEIKENDILALLNGDINFVEKTVEEAIMRLIKENIDESHEIITLFYGSDVNKEEADAISEKITEEYPHCDVECYSGGQPLYYYLISIE